MVTDVVNINNAIINHYKYINCFVKGTIIINSKYFQESDLNSFVGDS
jgi:hypothetical protein